MSATENPPAFAQPFEPEWAYCAAGMSLRDWFAGQALAGGRARDTVPDWQLDAWFGKAATGIKREQIVARDAYAIADAMLAQRAGQ